MQAYKYDNDFYYIGAVNCQLDPLETQKQGHNVWLIPANSTTEKPPKEREGYKIKWNGKSWVYEEIPQPQPEPEPTEDEKKQQVRDVRDGYLQSTDFTQLDDSPFTSDEKAEYREYRQYLRDYTDGESWWEQDPLSFDDWK